MTTLAAQAARPSRKVQPLVSSAAALMFATMSTSVLGLVFWAVSARLFTSAEVGRASALIAAMILFANLSQLNLTNVFTRFLPVAGHRTGRFVAFGYGAAGAVAFLLSGVFALTPGGEKLIGSGNLIHICFVLGCVMWTIFVIQDGVLTGLRLTSWVAIENLVFSLAKLLLLPALAVAGLMGVFAAWTLPVAAAVLAINFLVFRRVIPERVRNSGGSSGLPDRRQLTSFWSAEYLNSLVQQGLVYVMPILVATLVGVEANAYFYIPWLIGTSAFALFWNAISAFVVEAALDPSRLQPLLRKTAVLLGGIAIIGSVALTAGAPTLLGLLGPGYVAEGTDLLRTIGLTLPLAAVGYLGIAVYWLRARIWFLLGAQTIAAVITMAGSVLLMPRMDLLGVGVSLAAGQAVLVAMVIPAIRRAWRNEPGWIPPSPGIKGTTEDQGSSHAPSTRSSTTEQAVQQNTNCSTREVRQ